ncbi:MAG: prohibitin family protein [Nitrososphaerales archaeon]
MGNPFKKFREKGPEGEPRRERTYKQPNRAKLGVAIITAIVIMVVISQSVAIIDAGHRGVVLYLGAVEDRVLPEGFAFIAPFVEQVIQMEVRTLKYEAGASSSSQDLQIVTTVVALNYHLDPSVVDTIYQELGEDYADRIIAPTIQESVKASTAKFVAEALITQREEAKARIGDVIRETLIERGIITEQVFITDFQFSEDFARSVELKVVAQQEALREKNVLERVKVQAESREAEAIGNANANIAQAKGEAEAIMIIQEQLRESPDYLKWQAINKWNGRLPFAMGGGAFPFIDITGLALQPEEQLEEKLEQ